MIRQAAVAGSFYPSSPTQLSADVEQLLQVGHKPKSAKAIIAPHAGYVYSGSVAGELIGSTIIPETVLLIGPNHHGTGHDVAVTEADYWATPLGDIPINTSLKKQLCTQIPELHADERAHQFEHSIEVMLPLLLKSQPKLNIVPISLCSLSLQNCLQLGESIAQVMSSFPEDILLLASSDMSHFLDVDMTERLDMLAIQKMLDFDPSGLYRTVQQNQISMCGMLPAVVVMQAAQQLGASDCRLLRHTHSGQVNGDNNRVVGYASLIIN